MHARAWFRHLTAGALLLAGLAFSAAPAHADKRVALVLGNASYQFAPPLTNPLRDAEDFAAGLRGLGFAVTLERDLDKRGLERVLGQFARAAQDADTALVFYAGHGMQYRGTNFLLPIDARLEDEFSIGFELTKMDDVLFALDRARGVKILLLDACRNNPLAERLKGTTRDLTGTRGLARLDAPSGMIVAFSTQANQVAVDGTGRNSPFTAALVKYMNEPGLEIATLLRRVALEVNRATDGRQLPELAVSLVGEFYLNSRETDLQVWAKIRSSDNPVAFKDFLGHYPQSVLAMDARQRLAAIEHDRAERDRLAWERQQREEAERDRLEAATAAQERMERERLAREQVERDAAAKAEQERQRLAMEQAAQKATEPEAQIALLTAPAEMPAAAAPAPVSSAVPENLVAEIKKELARVGCYAGRIDDNWATTKPAAGKFAKFAKLAAPDEPLSDFLDVIRGKSGRICPLECGVREVARNGQCVAKTCPKGSILYEDGNCEKPSRSKDAARPSDHKRPTHEAALHPDQPSAPGSYDPYDMNRRITPGGKVTCGKNGCQTVPQGCYAVRRGGGHGMGGKIICGDKTGGEKATLDGNAHHRSKSEILASCRDKVAALRPMVTAFHTLLRGCKENGGKIPGS